MEFKLKLEKKKVFGSEIFTFTTQFRLKNSQNSVQLATTNLPQGATITASVPSSTSVVQHQSQSSQHSVASSSAPIGIVMGTNNTQSVPASQIAQIVNLNQSGINVGHGHQIVSNAYRIEKQAPIHIFHIFHMTQKLTFHTYEYESSK